MRIILDCNIIVMSLNLRSAYYNIYKAFLDEKYTLLVSQLIVHEYEEIVEKKFGTAVSETFLNILNESNNVEFKTIYYNWNLIPTDPDDNKYCDCYVAGAADYLVTQDKHFNILSSINFPAIKVLSIDDFLKMLNQF